MTTTTSTVAENHAPLTRTAIRVAVVMLIAALLTAIYAFYLSSQNNSSLGLTSAYLLLVFCGIAAFSAGLSRAGLPRWGMRLLIIGLLALMPVTSVLVAGAGVVLGLSVIVTTTAIAALTLRPRQIRWTILSGFISGILTLLIDLYWPLNRIDLPLVFYHVFLPAAAFAVVAIYGLFLARQFSTYTLRAKLMAAFVAVALVPLGLLAFLNNLAAQNTLTTAANRSLFAAAAQTATTLDDFISVTSNIVRTEALHPIIANYLSLPAAQRPGSDEEREVNALLNIFVQKDRHILSYLLLDNTGRVVAASTTPDLGQDKSGYDYFRVPSATAQSYVSPLDFSEKTFRGSLFFSDQVRSAASEPLGVLVERYNAEYLQEVAIQDNNLAGLESFVTIFDENHIRLAHGLHPELVFKAAAPLSAARLAELRAANRLPDLPEGSLYTNLPALDQNLTLAQAQPEPARPYYFAHQDVATGKVDQGAVAKMKNQPWLVVFSQPQKVFLAPAEEQTRNTVLLGVLITGLVALAAVGMSRYLVGPIARLTIIAAKVSAGDLTAQAKVESEDEIGILAFTFNNMTAQLQQTLTGLEERVVERTSQMQAAAEISRATIAMRDLGELLRLALELIRQRFGFYHASIFLMDEAGEFAVLRESTGEVGAELKARGHRLGVGSHSLVGWVAQNRRPRVALEVAGDPFYFKNPLLPDTRSELCIPLIAGDQLLGVMNVQSTELDAFDENAVQVLQTLADQLSVAIQNADLFERTQANLRQMSALYQQVTSTSWHTYVRRQPREIVYDLEPGAAARSGSDSSSAPLTIPLRMGEEVVGAIELYGGRTSGLAPEEQAILDTVATQISVALESAALFQDTQRRRNREQLINEITYQMRSTLNPAAIVQSGIRELGRALGATEVVVKLQPPGRSSQES